MTSLHRTAALAALLASTTLLGCPSKGEERPAGSPPTARAGGDASTFKGAEVLLDGRASSDPDGDALTWRWTQTAGAPASLDRPDAATTTFTAPATGGRLTFRLEVDDGRGGTSADTVDVVVVNRAPAVNAGGDLAVALGEVVTLSAAASDPDGDAVTVTWFQRSGPPVTLQAHVGGTTGFVAPATTANLAFTAVASDGEDDSAEDSLTVRVIDPAANWPPAAFAGPDETVARRARVQVLGGALDREGDPLTVLWTQLSGPPVTIADPSSLLLSFDAPAEACDLTFRLTVSDALSNGSDLLQIQVRNVAPFIAAALLSPSAPRTADDLSIEVQAYDQDLDPLTLAYAWTRNGAPVAGQVGASYPAGLTTKGDVIAVTVTASDGVLAGTATREVTIQDTPPVLSGTLPAALPWGEAAVIPLAATDADDEPVGALILDYGPAGMVLEGGALRWTPTLPLFEPALTVRFGLHVTGAPEATLAGSLRVEDPARQVALRRSTISIPVLQEGLVGGDLDGDGTAELLVASAAGVYELAPSAGGYAVRWSYPYALGAGSPRAVEARDLDGDGRQELFLAQGSAVVRLDGATRQVAARASVAPLLCRALEVADLAGDGSADLVCLAGSDYAFDSALRLVVLDPATLAVAWQTEPTALGTGLAVGNVDEDAALELVTSGGYVFDGVTHANEWASPVVFGDAVDTGDLDGDGVEEIVGMAGWYKFNGFSAVLKSPLWEQETFDNDALLVTDLDGDGVAEIVVGDGQWGNVTAWSYRPATNDLVAGFQLDSQDHGVTSIAAADLDGDGALELAWGSGASSSGEDVFAVAERLPAPALAWSSAGDPLPYGSFTGGLPARVGGGRTELLFQVPRTGSFSGARVVGLDPSTGQVSVGAAIGTNWDGASVLDVVDYDGDGVDEAFTASADLYDGYFAAWDPATGTTAWSSPKGLEAARAVAHGDLTADGHADLVGLTWDGTVYAFDVLNQVQLWKSAGLGSGGDVAVADLDGDGTPEIVALAGGRLVVFARAASGTVPWVERRSVAQPGSDLLVADLDGDGAPELLVLSASSSGLGEVVRYDAGLARLGGFTTQGSASAMALEAPGPAPRNLVLTCGETYAFSTEAPTLRAVDAVTGDEVWRSPGLLGLPGRESVHYVDPDGDGLRALAFGTSTGMHVTR